MNQTVQSQLIVLPGSPSKLLSSWKEIADYVGKGVRTVQRWERNHGLPVRRPAADSRIVIARTAEIDAWIAGHQVIAMPAEIDAWVTENHDSASNGKGSVEEQLAEAGAENAELRQQIAELRAQLNELSALNELRKAS